MFSPYVSRERVALWLQRLHILHAQKRYKQYHRNPTPSPSAPSHRVFLASGQLQACGFLGIIGITGSAYYNNVCHFPSTTVIYQLSMLRCTGETSSETTEWEQLLLLYDSTVPPKNCFVKILINKCWFPSPFIITAGRDTDDIDKLPRLGNVPFAPEDWVNLSGGREGVFQGLAGLLRGISRGQSPREIPRSYWLLAGCPPQFSAAHFCVALELCSPPAEPPPVNKGLSVSVC